MMGKNWLRLSFFWCTGCPFRWFVEWMGCKGFSFEMILRGHLVDKGVQEAFALYKTDSWRYGDTF